MDLIDTHCHFDVDEFDADRGVILERCRREGIRQIVVPAIHAAGWNKLLQLCRQEVGLYPALGLHPIYIELHQSADLLLSSLLFLVITYMDAIRYLLRQDFYLSSQDRFLFVQFYQGDEDIENSEG